MNFWNFTQLERALCKGRSVALLGLLTSVLLACGGGSSDSETSTANGQVALGLTDAEGDFLTYTVDVLSIKMTHANGNVVETLPLTTRVDFAQYTNLTEFLTVATVPQGRYTEASLTLDYRNADIQVEDAAGGILPVTTVQDKNGKAIQTIEVKVELAGNRAVPIAPGLIRYMLLDFDLAKSNVVAIANGAATVTVEPVLLVDVDKEAPKHHRLRGPMKSVNVDGGYYDLFIRPYFKRITRGEPVYGDFRVHTSDTTLFQIDGIPYQGVAGLKVLATKPEYTAVMALGLVRMNPLRFEATQVFAGSSVPGGTMDVVQGSVVARSGDVITVNGATLIRSDGSMSFSDGIKVTLFDSTVVTRELSMATYTKGDVSVGQQVMIFGTATPGSADFSAANGYVRMEIGSVRGTATAVPDVSQVFLTLNVTNINGRNAAMYDFTGTQASASSYEVDVGSLILSGVNLANDVSVRGFVTPFGAGPVDYTAQTMINYSVTTTIP